MWLYLKQLRHSDLHALSPGKTTGTYVHFDPAQDGMDGQTLTIRGPMLKVYRAHALLMKRYHETQTEASCHDKAKAEAMQSNLEEKTHITKAPNDGASVVATACYSCLRLRMLLLWPCPIMKKTPIECRTALATVVLSKAKSSWLVPCPSMSISSFHMISVGNFDLWILPLFICIG